MAGKVVVNNIHAHELDGLYLAVGLFEYWFPGQKHCWEEVVKMSGACSWTSNHAREVYTFYRNRHGISNLGGFHKWLFLQTSQLNEGAETSEHLAERLKHANPENIKPAIVSEGPEPLRYNILRNESLKLEYGVDKWAVEYRSAMRTVLMSDDSAYMPHPHISRMGAWHWHNMIDVGLRVRLGKSCEQLREDYVAYACQRAYSVNNLKEREVCPRLQLDHHDGYAAIAIFHSIVPDVSPQRYSNWRNTRRLRSAVAILLDEKVLPPGVREFDDWMSWFSYELFHNTKNEKYFNTDITTLNRVRMDLLRELADEDFLSMPGLRNLHEICIKIPFYEEHSKMVRG